MTSTILDWNEKHRPRTLSEIVGNKNALDALRAWGEAWDAGRMPDKRAVVLAGEPGVGKTTAAHALAHDLGWGVIELNASDQRNEEVIRRVATSGAVNRSLDTIGTEEAGRQLIILDEADNLFGREDRGGVRAITDTIRITRQPIVLIVNDYYELTRRGASLKTLAAQIRFTRVHTRSIPPALRRIAHAEGLNLGPDVAEAIAERAGGDLRSAVNDLAALAAGRTKITAEDVKALGKRDETGDVWNLLGKVFYGSDMDAARKASWDLDETPDSIALWIDENLPHLYQNKADLVDGYAALSRADVYLGRVSRRQQYGLWSYATEMMTAGVALAKHERAARSRFQFPGWLRKMSASRAVRDLRKRTSGKIAEALHTTSKRAREDMFPTIRQLHAADPGFAPWLAWRFDLTADELAFLLQLKATSKEIKDAMEQAESYGPHPAHGAAATPFSGYGDGAEEADTAEAEDAEDAPTQATLGADGGETGEEETAADSKKKPQKSLLEF